MILVVLVALSLASLATDTRGTFIRNGVVSVVSTTTYPFLKLLGGIRHSIRYVVDLVIAYDKTREETEAIRRQLVDVMKRSAQRTELKMENDRLRRMLGFVRNERGLCVKPVEVLEVAKGTLKIDRGSLHGVQESMCLVNEEGIVGRVTRVDLTGSYVITLHNPHFKVGAMIARNRVRGTVHGAKSDISRYCTMNYIDMKDDVRVNDRVVASPESFFPTGYPIGRVVRVDADTGSLWKTADVELAVDPYRLDEAFLLEQAPIAADELAGTVEDESVVSVAPTVPDMRSLQERYAP